MNPFHDIMIMLREFAEVIESIQHKSAEEISDFCMEMEIPPVEIMNLANQGVKYLKKEEECDDDPKELFPGVFDYLEHNGFTYDKEEGRFRERYSKADSQ